MVLQISHRSWLIRSISCVLFNPPQANPNDLAMNCRSVKFMLTSALRQVRGALGLTGLLILGAVLGRDLRFGVRLVEVRRLVDDLRAGGICNVGQKRCVS